MSFGAHLTKRITRFEKDYQSRSLHRYPRNMAEGRNGARRYWQKYLKLLKYMKILSCKLKYLRPNRDRSLGRHLKYLRP